MARTKTTTQTIDETQAENVTPETNELKSNKPNPIEKRNTTTTETKNKTKLKLSDDTLVKVKNNVVGKLVYINHKTGDETYWSQYDEIQSLYVADLRAMKAKQPDFFKRNWILIEGLEDDNEVDTKEVYDALMISQYYRNTVCPENIDTVFTWSVTKLKENLPKMTSSVKTSVVVRANELIKEGKLDSLAKIKTIEELLSCKLISVDD